MLSDTESHCFRLEPAQFITDSIKAFAKSNPANQVPNTKDRIFEEPLVGFADGDDPLFTEYKQIIAPTHLTPREALAEAYDKTPEELPDSLSVISWVLPISDDIRKANQKQTAIPARTWSYGRWYGEKFNDDLREYVVRLLTEMGYQAAAPVLQPFFKTFNNDQGPLSNWSERHAAYAAGLGTFSLSDGFITERGIAHRCGSVVTDLKLPPSPRTTEGPYANCLFYANNTCRICIERCPTGAISEAGHDKNKCRKYLYGDLDYLIKEYDVGVVGCGLCQVNVPCEKRNPVKESA